MNATESESIKVVGLTVHIQRKAIKNLHLAVLSPNGNVRVSVPLHITSDAIRLAIVDRLGWIKRQRQDFQQQPRQTTRRYVSEETQYFFGCGYRLRVDENSKVNDVTVSGGNRIDLSVEGTPIEQLVSVLWSVGIVKY